jgi:hypothetical protein
VCSFKALDCLIGKNANSDANIAFFAWKSKTSTEKHTSTININNGPDHVVGKIGGEEYHRPGDLFWRRDTTTGNEFVDL